MEPINEVEFEYKGKKYAILGSQDLADLATFWLSQWEKGQWIQQPIYFEGPGQVADLMGESQKMALQWLEWRENNGPWLWPREKR